VTQLLDSKPNRLESQKSTKPTNANRQAEVHTSRSRNMANHGDTNDAMHVERQTAPQEPYTMRDVGVGGIIAIIGALIVFAIPILATI
jgi:hypothetical protein